MKVNRPWFPTAFFMFWKTFIFEFFHMKSVFIFNPETDIVLGLNKDSYTPNKHIAYFRKRLSLLPALYANAGDIIVVTGSEDNEFSFYPFFDIAEAKELRIVRLDNLKSFINDESEPIAFRPWGWNREILKRLSRNHISFTLLPSLSFIERLRILSNRRLTIDFFKKYCYDNKFQSPRYLQTIEDIDDFIDSTPSFCLKAPWSSSGRGVIFSNSLSRNKIIEWAGGILKTQGGVMGENFYPRKMDFASEWIVTDKEIEYSGLSLFKSDNNGKYCGNRLLPQHEIENIIHTNSDWSPKILNCQKDFIRTYIQPFYQGPLGFDMLVTEDGYINPCVEINIRYTMGHVAIAVERQMTNDTNPDIAHLLKEKFHDGIFSVQDYIN